jgi:hypothetical protein
LGSGIIAAVKTETQLQESIGQCWLNRGYLSAYTKLILEEEFQNLYDSVGVNVSASNDATEIK